MPESLHVSVCTCMNYHCVHSSITKHISRLHACKIERVFDKICMHSSVANTFESLHSCRCECRCTMYFCVHSSIARSALRFSSALQCACISDFKCAFKNCAYVRRLRTCNQHGILNLHLNSLLTKRVYLSHLCKSAVIEDLCVRFCFMMRV